MKDFKLMIGGRRISMSELENKIRQENKNMKENFTKLH
jgi:hypothetical protein